MTKISASAVLLGAPLLALAAQSSPKPSAVSIAEGIAAFETVKTVLQNPRCQNCHIPGDAPLQLDDGRTHTMNVQRGPEGSGALGLACATCHAATNPPPSFGAHMPPGAPGWKLPPPQRKMVFVGLGSGELCRTIKDTRKNGGKDLAALVDHVDHDKLVLWGWSPGVGRNAVSVSHEQFVAAFKTWMAGGAPCPPPS
jgi:hypothetical protein